MFLSAGEDNWKVVEKGKKANAEISRQCLAYRETYAVDTAGHFCGTCEGVKFDTKAHLQVNFEV